jgi:7-carboxy-7-deazaguanine synthase
MNQQAIEKRSIREDGTLDVFKIFGPTFQGEGPFAGRPAIFIRLAGCNLQCPGCDTIYTGPERRFMSPAAILDEVWKIHNFGGMMRAMIIISGGEPFRQNLAPLLRELQRLAFDVQIETNGTLACPEYDITFERDINVYESRTRNPTYDLEGRTYIVCSPKTGIVHHSIMRNACAFKYVLSHDSVDPLDGLPVEVLNHTVKTRVARPQQPFNGPVYVNPMDHGPDYTESFEGVNVPDYSIFPNSVKNRMSLDAVKESCLRNGYILGLQLHKIIEAE